MIFTGTVVMEKEEWERVNQLLDIKSMDNMTTEEKALNPKEDDFIPLFSVDFENGNRLDIDVCSGSNNYYDNCVLKDKYENEIDCFDCNYSIDKEMEFVRGEDTYIVAVEVR